MCEVVSSQILSIDPNRKFGFTFIEALSVAIITNIDAVEAMSPAKLRKCYAKFSKIELLSTEALSADISKTESVNGRLEAAINSFK